MDLAEVTFEKMKELEGTVFETTHRDGKSVTMKLDEVAPIVVRQRSRASAPQTPKRAPFAMYFLAPPDAPILEQSMYELRSEKMTFENIFIVPTGSGELGTEYEAVFA